MRRDGYPAKGMWSGRKPLGNFVVCKSQRKLENIMKKTFLFTLLASAPFFSFKGLSETQTKPEKAQSEQVQGRPGIIAHKSDEIETFAYDAGTVRFLASSEDTDGAWSLLEVIEMPGYKTNLHRHNHTEEAFYVLEGELTARINDIISEYPAGSYILIPRGTPHAQGNRGRTPTKILLTMTPGGFEQSFKDRVELFKTMKPDDPNFRKKRKENAVNGNYDVEFLADWELPK
jgi:quercetin dioxygenase-like cupin family protein